MVFQESHKSIRGAPEAILGFKGSETPCLCHFDDVVLNSCVISLFFVNMGLLIFAAKAPMRIHAAFQIDSILSLLFRTIFLFGAFTA